MRGSLRQRRSGSWELRVHAGRDSATGKPAYVTRTVRGDRDAAERGLVALVAQITDSPTSPTFGTVGELCDKWWTHSSPNLAPTVAREYRRLIDRRVVPAFGHVKVVDLRAHQLDAWYGELIVGGAVSGRPLSANSVRHIHSVLHRALEQGIAWDWIAYNPARRASPPPARRPSIHLPTADEVVRLIEAAHAVNRSLPIFLRMAAVTGARRGELCALQWQHVDFHRQTLHIAGQIAHTAAGPVQRPTKTHAERRLTLDPVTLAGLGELRAARRVGANSYIFSHDPGRDDALAAGLRDPGVRSSGRSAGHREDQVARSPPLCCDHNAAERYRCAHGRRKTRPRTCLDDVGHLRPLHPARRPARFGDARQQPRSAWVTRIAGCATSSCTT